MDEAPKGPDSTFSQPLLEDDSRPSEAPHSPVCITYLFLSPDDKLLN